MSLPIVVGHIIFRQGQSLALRRQTKNLILADFNSLHLNFYRQSTFNSSLWRLRNCSSCTLILVRSSNRFCKVSSNLYISDVLLAHHVAKGTKQEKQPHVLMQLSFPALFAGGNVAYLGLTGLLGCD